MIEEVLPGLAHWSAFHDGIGQIVYSSFVLGSGTLIDPMEPHEGLDALAELAPVRRIVLSNRHHYRHSRRFLERFECPVLCHEAGLGDLDPARLRGFPFGAQLAEDVRALELGAICPEATTLSLDLEPRALSFADGLTRAHDGSLAFMPDSLLGDDPRAVRAGLRRSLRRILLNESFDALLFAHAEPLLDGGHAQLREFLTDEAG
jgi:hypothetical protein